MPVQEFFALKSDFDGLDLAMLCVKPDGEPRALVQLAHGMTDHKERYLPLMQFLAAQGCLCAINDHRGHGASVRSADDLGYFYRNGHTALVEDLHQITRWMRAQWPGKKLFLLGHSMGSLAVRAYCDAYDREIDGLIVVGSPGKNPALGFGLAYLRLSIALRGERHRSKTAQTMATGVFARRFPDPDHPFAWVSASMQNVLAYEGDPLCTFNFTLNGYQALLRLMKRCYGLKAPRGNPGLPIRFYSGADDPCAPNARGFQAAMDSMRRAGYADVQGRMFPGLRHELLNEDCQQEIFAIIWQEALLPHI